MEYTQHNQGDDPCKKRPTRKRLVSENSALNVRGQEVPNLASKVVGTVLMIENSALSTEEELAASATPGKAPHVKRSKQGNGEEGDDYDMINEVDSQVEDHQDQ